MANASEGPEGIRAGLFPVRDHESTPDPEPPPGSEVDAPRSSTPPPYVPPVAHSAPQVAHAPGDSPPSQPLAAHPSAGPTAAPAPPPPPPPPPVDAGAVEPPVSEHRPVGPRPMEVEHDPPAVATAPAADDPTPQPEPADEASSAERAAEAAARATDAARDLTAAAGVTAVKAGRSVSEASQTLSRRRSKGVRNTPNRRRLRAELAVFSIRLQACELRAGRRAPWMEAADTLTIGAAEAVKEHETIEGWSLLWAAEREAMEGLREEELVAEGEAAVREARYLLGPDEAQTVARSLQPAEGDDPSPSVSTLARVRGARDLFDRMRIETYRRLREEGRRLSGLGLLVLAFLLAAGLAVGFGVVDGGDGEALGGLDDFLAVAGFGACGAVVSMLVPWSSSSNRPAILDFVNPTDLTVLRVATGAALAVALVVVLQVVELSEVLGAQAYPWAFAAGFGERVIDKRLDAVDAAARDTEAG